MTAIAPANKQNLLTFETYLDEFRTQPPIRQPYYILDGVVIMPPAPRFIHQTIIHRLEVLLDAFERIGAMLWICPSPLDVVIRRAPLRTRQPDILVMSEARCAEAGGIHMEGPITAAPELVMEVLSPSETRRTIDDKIGDFQEIGVRECWIVSPEAETVEVLSLTKSAIHRVALYSRSDEVQSVVFPDVKFPVNQIFA